MTLHILILAAGGSSRMRGGDKLLEDVGGQPCLEVMVARALATHHPVWVTLPALDHPRAACLAGYDISRVAVPDAALGMSRSLQRGINALPEDASGVMILPADMPGITSGDISRMLVAFHEGDVAALRATTQAGEQGHPTVISAALFDQFRTLSGDVGAQSILKTLGSDVGEFPLDGDRARMDLDTPEDWSSWRARP